VPRRPDAGHGARVDLSPVAGFTAARLRLPHRRGARSGWPTRRRCATFQAGKSRTCDEEFEVEASTTEGPGATQEVFERLEVAVFQRYDQKGVPGVVRLLQTLQKWVGLFTAFGQEDGRDLDAIATRKLLERLAAPQGSSTWARDHLTAEQRTFDRTTLRLLLDELGVLQERHGMARMLSADPVLSLMAVSGADEADPVDANRAASNALHQYLEQLRAARLLLGDAWWTT
jgi:hypothetical protein